MNICLFSIAKNYCCLTCLSADQEPAQNSRSQFPLSFLCPAMKQMFLWRLGARVRSALKRFLWCHKTAQQCAQEAKNLTLQALQWAQEAKGGSVCDSHVFLNVMVTFGCPFVLLMWCTCGPDLMCETVCDACQLVLMYVVNVNLNVMYVWTWLLLFVVHVVMHIVCIYVHIYVNCVRYGIKLQGRFCQIFIFWIKMRGQFFGLKSDHWPSYGVSIGHLTWPNM